MAVAADAFFVANGLGKGLAQGDADVFDGVVAVNVQVAGAFHVQINQAVAGDLVKHVIEKANARIESRLAGAVQIHAHVYAGFGGVALHFGGAGGDGLGGDSRHCWS